MPPIAAVIASVVASAVTAGTSIYQAQDYKGPDTNQAALDAKANADATAKQAAGMEAQKTALLRRAAPDAQAATGGSLAPDAFAAFTSMLAGMPGENQLASRVFGGNNSGLTSPSSSPQMATMGQPSSPISGGETSGASGAGESGGMMEMIMNLFNGNGNGNNAIAGAGGSDSSGGFGMEDTRNSFAYGY